MKIFKPIKDVSDLIQRSLDSTRENIDKFFGKGFKGGLKDIFDFSADGLIQKADFDLGIGILHLMMDKDQKSVDTAIAFRNDFALRVSAIDQMASLIKQFKAEDLTEVKKAAKEMEAFLARGEVSGAEPPTI
ncbi:MAG: hypothetical protein ACYC99_11840 [Candidatus Geothermincolia bacterium]